MRKEEPHPIYSAIKKRLRAEKTTPPSDLSKYRTIVSSLPRPSDEQVDNFVQFVSEAHSWYKHLPLLPPGRLFRFFIDPNAGRDRIIQSNGQVTYEDRIEGGPELHYTWMTTSDYHRRFGRLAYHADAGTSLFVSLGGRPREQGECPIIMSEGESFRIPLEVSKAGALSLTAVIHPLTARAWVWETFLPRLGSRRWPKETGGERTLARIWSATQRVPKVSDEISDELTRLLEPERNRLHDEMRKAINRMLRLVYE